MCRVQGNNGGGGVAERVEGNDENGEGKEAGGGGGGKDACWLSCLTSSNTTAVFVDTDTLGMGVAYDSRVGDLVQNEVEADLVVQLVGALVGKWGVDKKDVGVISLYRQQVKLIKSLLAERRGVVEADGEEDVDEDVEVLTADKSQGRDKECIVVSMVRSNEECKVCCEFRTRFWRHLC